MQNAFFVIYVKDQVRSREFYQAVLGTEPALDVPGMTAFQLTECSSLGIMPEEGIAKILGDSVPHPKTGNGIPRCELYLTTEDPGKNYEALLKAGGKGISEMEPKPWGDMVAYGADLDGHVLAFACPIEEG